MAQPNGSADVASWQDLPGTLEERDAISKINNILAKDPQFVAFATTDAITEPIKFGIKSAGSGRTLVVTIDNGSGKAAVADSPYGISFILSAQPEEWAQFFQSVPPRPYQSYTPIRRMNMSQIHNIKQDVVEDLGSELEYSRSMHLSRRVLELLREAYNGGPTAEQQQEETDEDFIVGRYVYIDCPKPWGRCKLFVEESGEGEQQIIFLHTAGSDSRQYHGVMNDGRMRKMSRMITFDLPSHGRSFPSQNHPFGAYTNNEDVYVGTIAAMIKKLGLDKPIICGASMAGQVSLACAIRYKEVGCSGTIPLQASDYIDMKRSWHTKSPYVNQSLHNAESTYGLMAPTTPAVNKALIWHTYSAQAYGIFHGDLDFYVAGWDGRSRMSSIDTKACPVYLLTGEYDWSNTPQMSKHTADKIPGAKFKSMEGLGHFPATENPKKFIPHLIEAIEHIQQTRQI